MRWAGRKKRRPQERLGTNECRSLFEWRNVERHGSVDEIHLARGNVDQAIGYGVKRVHVEYCAVFLPNAL